MSAVELEFVEAAVVPEDENCNFIYDQIRLNLSKMNQIGLNRISHLSKNVTINIFHLYPEDKLGYFFLDHTWIKLEFFPLVTKRIKLESNKSYVIIPFTENENKERKS